MFVLPNKKDYLYQWDSNIDIEILQNFHISEVHFYDPLSVDAMVMEPFEKNGKFYVRIPNILLTYGEDIVIWGVKKEDESSLTEIHYGIHLKKRQKPSDYVYTETEVKSYEALEKRVEALEKGGNLGPGEGISFVTDETLKLEDGILSVNTTQDVEQDNTLPITSSGVFTVVGNIEALLKTI